MFNSSPTLSLQDGTEVLRTNHLIAKYYEEMGRGPRAYDQSELPPGPAFAYQRLQCAAKLAGKLGARQVPHKSLEELSARLEDSPRLLGHIPPTFTLMDPSDSILWDQVLQLLKTFRVPYISRTRLTKMLHKELPNLIPILDKRVVEDYLSPLHTASSSVSRERLDQEAEETVRWIKALKIDVDQNKPELVCIARWPGLPYPISPLRVLDIVLWCRCGPYKSRFVEFYHPI